MSLKAVTTIGANQGVVSLNGEDGNVTLTSTGGSIVITTPTSGTVNIESNSGGSGTVTSVSVVSANGLAGTVATATTTPAITLSTSVTGVLKGNGTAISAATSGTDYSAGTSALATGILKSTTTTGSLSIAIAGTDYQAAGNYLTALTGDVTASGPGSSAATLATVNTNTGSFGSSTSVPSFTVNGKGLITAASGNVVIAPAGTLSGTTLASNVVTSSLTAVGTLADLTVTNAIAGSVTGNAGTVTTINGLIAQGTNITITGSGTFGSPYTISASGGATPSFSVLSSGTNTTAAMVIGTGASLAVSGSGTIAATSAPASGITGTALATNVVTSSLTSTGALASGSLAAGFTAVTVPIGGTGLSSTTAYAPIFGGTTSTSALQSGTVGTSGQVLTSNGAGALPTFQAATSLIYTVVTGTTQSAAVGNAYITNNASQVTVTLPSTAAVGNVVGICGLGIGGWLLAQNASQLVHFGNQVTTTGTGGSLASTNQFDCVQLVCIVANTTWTVTSAIGNLTVT